MRQGPALLFENIRGHERTFARKLFTNGLGTRSRLNLMLGLDPDAMGAEAVRRVRERLRTPIEPVSLATGPVKQNIITGADVDLFQIPVPRWHPLDGGRYINTFCGVVTRDPDTGAQNVGLYRGMILERNQVVSLLIPSKDWGLVFEKYRQRRQPMPVAVFYGYDPTLILVAGTPVVGSEYALAGGLLGEPIELVRCETSDIEVPARAEIVVEGTISTDPSTYRMEGPFGDGIGRYSERGLRPVLDVSCITHRDDPVYQGALSGLAPGVLGELNNAYSFMMTVPVWNTLDALDIPGVLDLVLWPVAAVKIHKTHQGQPRQIAAALWGSKFGGEILKTIVVVEEDVDIHDPTALIGAVQSKVNFDRDLVVYPLYYGSAIDESITLDRKAELKYGSAVGSTLLVDATTDWELHPRRPEYGNERFAPHSYHSRPETIERVSRRWAELGI
jgi:4-hydroxy-3-polyprenylbenzoate decarboxylase